MIPLDYSDSQVPSSEFLYDLWMRQIYSTVHDGKFNHNSMLVGNNRTGKSMSAINMGLILDKDFSIDNVVWTNEQYLDRVSAIKNIGEVVIADEIGVMLSSRDWYSASSKAINFTIQTQGYLRPIVIFVAPDFSYIDNQPKKLFHQFSEVTRRTYDNFSRIKPFNLQIDRKKGKMYFHYPRFMIKEFGLVKLHRIKIVGTPPEDIVKEYEKKSYPYKKKIQEEAIKTAKSTSKLQQTNIEEGMLSQLDVIAEVLKNPSNYSIKGRIKPTLIINDFMINGKKISNRKAYEIKDIVEREIRKSNIGIGKS